MTIKLIVLLLAICATAHAETELECGACMDNEALCVDETSYYPCFNGKPIETLYKCKADEFCTNSDNICETEDKIIDTIIKPCSDECGKCPQASVSRYTCVSRTQFARCTTGTTPTTTDIIVSCPAGQVCSMDAVEKLKTICVPECVLEFLNGEATCSNDEITTSTAPPPSTPTIESLREQCETGFTGTTVFALPNKSDKSCKTYVHCEKLGENDYEAVVLACTEGTYFDPADKCVSKKPTSCE